MKTYQVKMQVGPGNASNIYGEFATFDIEADSPKEAWKTAQQTTGHVIVVGIYEGGKLVW